MHIISVEQGESYTFKKHVIRAQHHRQQPAPFISEPGQRLVPTAQLERHREVETKACCKTLYMTRLLKMDDCRWRELIGGLLFQFIPFICARACVV